MSRWAAARASVSRASGRRRRWGGIYVMFSVQMRLPGLPAAVVLASVLRPLADYMCAWVTLALYLVCERRSRI